MSKKTVGQMRLRKWITELDIKQYEAADILEISAEHISRLLAGTYIPSLGLAVRIKQVAKIAPEDWLEEGDLIVVSAEA